jgi:hypothetical protein
MAHIWRGNGAVSAQHGNVPDTGILAFVRSHSNNFRLCENVDNFRKSLKSLLRHFKNRIGARNDYQPLFSMGWSAPFRAGDYSKIQQKAHAGGG